jgi:bifunctional isochorismate lyase/aryl carrier protein
MKDAYFLEENIKEVAGEMFQQVIGIHRRDTVLKAPRQSALIVLDMQEYFLNVSSHAYLPSAGAIIPGINRLIETYQAQGRPVIFTRHLNTDSNAGTLKTWWSDLITEENPLSELSRRLPFGETIVIQKSQYDAFYNTDMGNILTGFGVQHVLICGVMTHLCCETTARSAFVHGFEVWFAVDGTATQNEEFQRATLLNLSHGFATPVMVDEVLEVMGNDD